MRQNIRKNFFPKCLESFKLEKENEDSFFESPLLIVELFKISNNFKRIFW
ncbi:hypothetical protein LEP1GSC137_0122 [Leptospira borgpetersenii str. Noumea 25]|nr:hypothetical protein LEP1GSC137_0122 [Leptospira borgpetersenii str. Noumea 25]